MADNSASDQLSRPRTVRLVLYNLFLTLLFSLLLYQVIMSAAEAEARRLAPPEVTVKAVVQQPAAKTAGDAATASDTLASEGEGDTAAAPVVTTTVSPAVSQPQTPQPADPRQIAYVLWAISLAGGLGGVLSNLRGVFGFTRDQSYFPAYLELPFYLRPVSGVLCGLFTFFVSSFFSGSLSPGDTAGWQTLQGMFPYIGIAFIAGFASQEFMERLKETAQTLFGVQSSAGNTVEVVSAPPPPAAPPANDDEGHESFRADDSGLESFTKEPAPPPAAPPPMVIVPPPARRKAD